MLPIEGSRLDDPNQNTHLRMSAHHEDPPGRLLTGLGKRSATIFKKKNVVGETLFILSDFKTKSFEKFISWEIAARKLDFAASE